jgi:DNA-directed RNA polymerase sigma subunit (sigma70/sigma32)
MGTTANQKKLFFKLRKAKSEISAFEEGDLRPDLVDLIAKRLGVTEKDVVDMNRRLGGDASLSAPLREDGDTGDWQDWLVDDHDSHEAMLAESEQMDNRRAALSVGLTVLDIREQRIFSARRLADGPMKLETLAEEFGISRERVRQIEGSRLREGAERRPATGGRHGEAGNAGDALRIASLPTFGKSHVVVAEWMDGRLPDGPGSRQPTADERRH